MTADDETRALERYVAGLDVDEQALAAAVTGRAVDRTIVVEALLTALASPHTGVRRRAAQRVARMADIAPRVAAELTVIAATDPDEGARDACVAALQAHTLPVPGATQPAGAARSGREPAAPSLGERLLASLVLRPMIMRSAQAAVHLVAHDRADLAGMYGTLKEDDDGTLIVELRGLPPEFAGTRPTVRVRRDANAAAFTAIATAAEPVSADGQVTVRIGPDAGPVGDVRRCFDRAIELVVSGR